MNETHLARLESSKNRTTTPATNSSKFHWNYQIEASCWLFLALYAPDIDLMFCLEYTDSLKKHSIVIDRAKVSYLRDSLMAGRVVLEGFGDFKDARLFLLSSEVGAVVDVRSLNFNIVRSSTPNKPQCKLIA